jgi:DNA-binding NarL/FixJ family response regulator
LQAAASRDESAAAVPLRVLIVEDEIFIQLDLEQMLTAAGFEVVGTSDNCADAIRLAERERPDAVLVDIRLRGPRDGVDMAMELWNRLQIRSLFVSGNIDEGTKLRAAPAHPLGFVKKPFDADQIVFVLTSIRH